MMWWDWFIVGGLAAFGLAFGFIGLRAATRDWRFARRARAKEKREVFSRIARLCICTVVELKSSRD